MLVSGRVTVCYMVFIDGWELALQMAGVFRILVGLLELTS